MNKLSKDDIIDKLSIWGEAIISNLEQNKLDSVINQAELRNPWFTASNQRMTIRQIGENYLAKENLQTWIEKYESIPVEKQKTIGIVMAGNIPLVGFHDLLCVLISGHRALIKLSDKDKTLLPAIIKTLELISPELAQRIESSEILKGFDAIIATGSNNTSRYFEYYFGKYPNIIRKNRNSIGIIQGNESKVELEKLADDVFFYFGLGCRSISKLFVPENYNFEKLFEAMKKYEDMLNHNKYKNNYDYYKSLLLLNNEKHLDTGFLLVKEENQATASPVASIYYETYKDTDGLLKRLAALKNDIQCMAAANPEGNQNTVPFGQTQFPAPNDYADNIDTLEFLRNL